MRKPLAPDWARIINDIVGTGMTLLEISKAPDVSLSLRAITYLRNADRGQQPIFHRGEYLLRLWTERTGKARDEAPMAEVLRGLRKSRQAVDRSPQLQALPDWPPAVQHVEMQGRGRKARKVREPA